jgi:hypothetical protein
LNMQPQHYDLAQVGLAARRQAFAAIRAKR